MKIFILTGIFFGLISVSAFSQSNLYLVNMKTERMKLIPIGSSEILRIDGLNKPKRFELINVTDTSIVLKGHFINNQKPVEQSYTLQQITSIRKIDAGHTALRIVFGVIGGSAVVGLTADAISNKEPKAVSMIIIGGVIASIPFLMPRRDWKLGEQKYKLVIR